MMKGAAKNTRNGMAASEGHRRRPLLQQAGNWPGVHQRLISARKRAATANPMQKQQ